MKRINTLEQLRAERKNLRYQQILLEKEIKKDLADIKTSLEPVRLVGSGIKKVLVSGEKSILGTSAGSIVNFLTRNVLLKNSGFITRLIVPYLVKNATSSLVEDNKSKIVDWVSELITRFTKKKTSQNEESIVG